MVVSSYGAYLREGNTVYLIFGRGSTVARRAALAPSSPACAEQVKRSTGHTHTHTTAEQTTHTNTERAMRRTREEQGCLCQLWSVLT